MELMTLFFAFLLISSSSAYLHNDRQTSTISPDSVRRSMYRTDDTHTIPNLHVDVCPSECECTEYRNRSTVTCSRISKSTTAFQLPANTRRLYLNNIDTPLEQIPWLFNQTPWVRVLRVLMMSSLGPGSGELDKLENDCAVNVDGDNIRMIIGSVVTGLCFITVTIGIIYWRRRINYYICFLPKFKLEKIFWQKFKGYGVLDNEEAYTYDVFVAYSQHNRHWVTHDLNDRLTAAGVSSCIADIVFPPGECITEIIVRELRKSRCILLVVSNEFLRSEWCHFEASMAILLQHKVMVVTMEDVSYRIMPAVIYYMMKSKTRLRFPPENPELQEKFWTNLTETLLKMKRMPAIVENAGEPWRY